MKLPTMILGEAKEVLPRVRKEVRRFLKGERVFEEVPELVDVNEFPAALIQLEAQIEEVPGEHFRLYSFMEELSRLEDRNRASRADVRRAFAEIAASSWARPLLMTGEALKMGVRSERINILKIGLENWGDWTRVGARYTFAYPYGTPLFHSPNAILISFRHLAEARSEEAWSWVFRDEASFLNAAAEFLAEHAEE